MKKKAVELQRCDLVFDYEQVQNELYLLCLDRKMMCEYDAYNYFIKCANLKTGVVNNISIESISFDRMWIDEKYIFAYETGNEYSWNCFNKRTGKRLTERSFNLRDDDFKLFDIRQSALRVVELADINEKGVFVREFKDIEAKNQGVWLYQIPFNNGKMSKSNEVDRRGWFSEMIWKECGDEKRNYLYVSMFSHSFGCYCFE